MLNKMGTLSRRKFVSKRQTKNLGILDVFREGIGPHATCARGGLVRATRPAGSDTFLSSNPFISVMLSPLPGMSAAYGEDKLQTFDAPRGMILILPADVEVRSNWGAIREEIFVGISSDGFQDLAAREFGLDHANLHAPPFGTIDLHALQMAELVKIELAQESINEIYVESLIMLFGIHLLRHYTGAGIPTARSSGALSVTAAQRVRAYLDEHFTRKLTVAELAAIGELSPGHFINAFTRSFGEPPHRYIVNRRLSFAEKLLVETDITIAEVAFLSGFSSQSHLTSTMRRYRRITPAQIRTGR